MVVVLASSCIPSVRWEPAAVPATDPSTIAAGNSLLAELAELVWSKALSPNEFLELACRRLEDEFALEGVWLVGVEELTGAVVERAHYSTRYQISDASPRF